MNLFVRWKIVLLPGLLLLMVTIPHLNQGDFRRDTGRYAAVGLSMWRDSSPLRPQLNPETPYFEKPPLALCIHGFFLRVFGVHLTVARAPSILAAFGIIIFNGLIVRMLATRAEAMASGLVLALTYEFFRRTREISLDLWQLFFLMMAAFLVVRAAKSDKRQLLALAGVPIGLALLCKPLVGLALLPILGFWLVLLGRRSWCAWLVFWTLPVALAVALPWH